MIEPTYKVEKVILDTIWGNPFYRDLMRGSEGNAQLMAHDIFQNFKKEAKKDDSMYLDIY